MSLLWAMYVISVAQTRQVHNIIVDLHLKCDIAYILPQYDNSGAYSSVVMLRAIRLVSQFLTRPILQVGRMNSRVALQFARLESGPITARGVKAVQCKPEAEHHGRCEARRCDVR
jgi:hypothetical protein